MAQKIASLGYSTIKRVKCVDCKLGKGIVPVFSVSEISGQMIPFVYFIKRSERNPVRTLMILC